MKTLCLYTILNRITNAYAWGYYGSTYSSVSDNPIAIAIAVSLSFAIIIIVVIVVYCKTKYGKRKVRISPKTRPLSSTHRVNPYDSSLNENMPPPYEQPPPYPGASAPIET
jgi:hypothetical protein